ncbi:MAG TPA: hypothetical protein VIC57_06760, partial [Candidatus Dormibacteraeota bacterium]
MGSAEHARPWLVSRRNVLKAGMGATLASQLAFFDELVVKPDRPVLAAGPLPNIQFDIGNFIAPAQTINGVNVRFGPVFVLFVPLRLNRTPT